MPFVVVVVLLVLLLLLLAGIALDVQTVTYLSRVVATKTQERW